MADDHQDNRADIRSAWIVIILGVCVVFGAIVFALFLDEYHQDRAGLIAVIGLGLVLGGVIMAALSEARRASKDLTARVAPLASRLRARGRQIVDDASSPRPITGGLSAADELRKWIRLRDEGLVTAEEFEAARAKIVTRPTFTPKP